MAAYASQTAMPLDSTQAVLCGWLAGVGQAVVGHPFDTIKTQLQATGRIRGVALPSLMRGIVAPVVGCGLIKSVEFGTYTTIRQRYDRNAWRCGALTGLAASIVETPIELVKVKQQLGQRGSSTTARIRGILSLHGPSGLWQGWTATALRNMPGTACYFGVYAYLTQRWPGHEALCGAAGGTAYYLGCYPLDVLKTRVQQDAHPNRSIWHAITGLRPAHLYRGFGICILRAIPANAAAFWIWEYSIATMPSVQKRTSLEVAAALRDGQDR